MKTNHIKQDINSKSVHHHIKIAELRESLVPNYENLNAIVQKQVDEVLNILLSKKDKRVIQAISRSSVLDQSPALRSHLWKLQLETLPLNPNKWSQTIQGNYQFYHQLVQKLFPKGLKIQSNYDKSKKYENFDEQLWSQISLDIKRTHTVLSFFKTNVEFQSMYQNVPTKHSDILGRILYIWGKVNPRIRYVQGMNQMIAPIYFLEFQNYNKYSESQVFFMFTALMTFAIDMHMKQLDSEDHGILGRIGTLNKYIKVVDYEIWKKLEEQNIVTQHYAFRWLALLFGQEFQLHDIILLWDALLSFDGSRRFFFLYCICLSIVKLRKEDILNNDMVGILPKLHKIRDLDIDHILDLSFKLYEKYSKINIDKLCLRMQLQFKNRQKQQQEKENSKTQVQKSSWDYSSLFRSTTNFFSNKIKDLSKKETF